MECSGFEPQHLYLKYDVPTELKPLVSIATKHFSLAHSHDPNCGRNLLMSGRHSTIFWDLTNGIRLDAVRMGVVSTSKQYV
jgi:hypothetical protein